MIRIAFLDTGILEWTGGINYLKNLLYAIDQVKNKNVEVYLFISKKKALKLTNTFSANCTVIQTSIFDRKSILWSIWRVFYKIFNSHIILTLLLKKYKINIISHGDIYGKNLPFKIISWIPDFQHIYLPEMFGNEKILNEINRHFHTQINNSNIIIVSSEDAKKDIFKFSNSVNPEKVFVLKFVSQPNNEIFKINEEQCEKINAKYSIGSKFFYLPNQFWKHKNHRVVFEALLFLKNQGQNILLVCTGNMNDYRNLSFTSELKEYIQINDLNDNIRLLGLIDYYEVMYFMRYSIAVINPSLFEGWSSTVEECKSIGKSLILSDISVHREQMKGLKCDFFKPTDYQHLANILETKWQSLKGGPDYEKELNAKAALKDRTHKFAETYLDMLNII